MMKLCSVVWLILTSLVSLSWGQPVPRTTALSREWVQRGTTNDLTISGEDLRDAQSIHVSGGSGVLAVLRPRHAGQKPVEVETSRGGVSAGEVDDGKSLQVRVAVAPDALLGSREVRVVTAFGVSNPLPLNISSVREIPEAEAAADALRLPVGISGSISDPGQTDRFRFQAKRGEDLVAEVLAFRRGSPLDSSLAIDGPGGQELARSEDAKGFDSFLHFRVPEDGEYVVGLRDFRYEGGAEYRYHLVIGAIPCIDSAFPLGAQRGQAVEVNLAGVNLGGVRAVSLKPALDAPLGWQEIRVHTPAGISTPFPFCVSDLPEVQESEPNNSTNQANRISVPVTINGRIQAAKDADFFQFKAEKTGALVCEITAQRFGSPLDALLTLQDAAGKVLQQNDDADGADARIEFAFQKGQEYVLGVRDLLGRGGEDHSYRLSIRPPEPDFALRFTPDTPRLHCGGRAFVQVEVSRRAGFNDAVQVAVEDLPAGLSSAPVLLTPDGPGQALLSIEAGEKAAGGAHPFKVTGTAVMAGSRVSRPAEAFSGSRPAQEALIAVLDTPAPFRLDLLALSLSLEQGQAGELAVLVSRQNGDSDDVKLTLEGYSSGQDSPGQTLEVQPVTVRGNESRAVFKFKVKPDAAPGLRPIYVRGEATVDGAPVVQNSQSIPLQVREVPFTLANTMKRLSVTVLPPGAKSAAAEAEFAVRASRRGWFTDEISLALEGLPDGITATATNLPNRVTEAGFKLTATSKAAPGKEFQITVVGSAALAGRVYQQRTAPMTLSITPPQEVADAK